MKAAIYTRYGPPEVVSIQEIEKPQPGPSEILIRVAATTVNRTDTGFRSAEYFVSRFFSGLFKPKGKVLGNEFAGTVEATGSDVKLFNVGDRVFGYNDSTFGAHAEYMVMQEDAPVATIPEGLSFSEAAPITEGSHYALCDLRAANLKAGQKMLINGSTGAIGSAAVQLSKFMGAEVTAICHAKHVGLVKSLGADQVIDYTTEDFTKLDTQFDIVFDAVGKSTFGKCKPLLKPKGIYMSTELGPGVQNPFLALITPLFGGKRLLFPIPTISKEDVLFLRDRVERGEFKPIVDRTYSLDEIVEAHRFVGTGMKTGNVVIRVV